MSKKLIVLINLGTPDAPNVKAVRRYLTQFLNDRRVIDIPWIFRKILVNLIIIPFRVRKSTGLYKRLWTENGSPLLYHLNQLVEKLQNICPEDVKVLGAMRYGTPGLKELMSNLDDSSTAELIILPLFPQYASSTTGSINEVVLKSINNWSKLPKINLIKQFYDHPAFVDVYSQHISAYNPDHFDHVIFSYHGLPLRQISRLHETINCSDCTCEERIPEYGKFCYRATCYETTHLITEKLQLNKDKYSVTFQSRLTRNWLSPFTDEAVVKLAKDGKKKILVIAPSFVADCLETTIELGEDYKKLFMESGGEELVLASSLNSSDHWVRAIKDIVGA